MTFVQLSDSCPRDISVWLVPVRMDLSRCDTYWQMLSVDERIRASRFVHPLDRARFLTLRIALRTLLSQRLNIDPDKILIEHDIYGRPSLQYPQKGYEFNNRIDFNVSHSGGYGMIAISSSRRVGIDIEQYDLTLDWRKLAAMALSPSESAHIDRLPSDDQLVAFYGYWTAKESLLKCAGIGLKYSPHRISLPLHKQRTSRWSMDRLTEYVTSPVPAPNGCAAHVAWERRPIRAISSTNSHSG